MIKTAISLGICCLALTGCGDKKSEDVKPMITVAPHFPPSKYPDVKTVSTENKSSTFKFHEKTEVFSRMSIFDGEFYTFVGPGYSFGSIETGDYAGFQLVLADIYFDGPCKGEGCYGTFARFILKEKDLIYLPKNSRTNQFEEPLTVLASTFSAHGYSLIVDEGYSLDRFENYNNIPYSEGRFSGWNRFAPMPDKQSLTKVLQHEIYGDVYFDGDVFYADLPDGSSWGFRFLPDITIDQIVWISSPTVKNKSGYSWQKLEAFGSPHATYETYISSSDITPERDLRQIGSTQKGSPIYGLKDQNHRLLKELYSNYRKGIQDEIEYRIRNSTVVPYTAFVESVPLFIWIDPFGRLTRFTNNDFLPTYWAEPIIYLYSPLRQTVRVEVHPKEGIAESDPPYEKGWNVYAEPDGSVTTLAGKKYPYLFWEGFGPVWPMREEGYVVTQKKVGELFDSVLPELGLNEKEITDFKTAWLPRFKDASYYFITFIDTETIDQLAPLKVNPTPDTTIRVLMDYQPLGKEKTVFPPTFRSPRRRNGFTVVEWGGIRRGMRNATK